MPTVLYTPQAVRYLLLNFVTGADISSASQVMHETRQLITEDKWTYTTGLNMSLFPARNVHPSSEIVCMYVDGLLPTVSPLIEDFYHSKPSEFYMKIEHHAQHLGGSQRELTK